MASRGRPRPAKRAPAVWDGDGDDDDGDDRYDEGDVDDVDDDSGDYGDDDDDDGDDDHGWEVDLQKRLLQSEKTSDQVDLHWRLGSYKSSIL